MKLRDESGIDSSTGRSARRPKHCHESLAENKPRDVGDGV